MDKMFNNELMLLSASGFQEAFQSFYNIIQELEEPVLYSKNIHYFDVATVNAAFACEIYLKFLLIHDSTNPEFSHKHDILALFNSLSNTIKKEITEHISSKYSEQDFLVALTIISDDFVNFRYSYERSYNPVVLNFDFYHDFLETLCFICNEKKTRA